MEHIHSLQIRNSLQPALYPVNSLHKFQPISLRFILILPSFSKGQVVTALKHSAMVTNVG